MKTVLLYDERLETIIKHTGNCKLRGSTLDVDYAHGKFYLWNSELQQWTLSLSPWFNKYHDYHIFRQMSRLEFLIKTGRNP